MSWQFLSHTLSKQTPGYGGVAGFFNTEKSRMCVGDSCNSQHWEMSNHIGTHIDAPLHFAKDGSPLDSFAADFWVFKRPHLLELPMSPGEILMPSRVESNVPLECDLLILRTGFEKYRLEPDYWSSNPGLSPELGSWLRELRPNLRCIGFDFISVTSYLHRPLGREAHRAFLDPNRAGSPILPVEDMHLSELRQSPQMVIIAPLRVENADGGPVTVMAYMTAG